MTRAKNSVAKKQRHKKILAQARGYRGSSHRNYKWAKEALLHAWSHAYRDRRLRKRDFRSLWILRIGSASRQAGLTYSQFVHGLKNAKVDINRKMLAEMAVKDPRGFQQLVATAQEHLAV